MKLARNAVVLVVMLAVAAASTGCSPANFAGTYGSIDVTNDPGTCGLPGWTSGAMSSASATITQAAGASAATLELSGGAALAIGLLVGGTHLAGSVSGSSADFTLDGTVMQHDGACTYTVDMVVHITISGDIIRGTVTYTPRTNHDAACGIKETCHDTEQILGSRPPSM